MLVGRHNAIPIVGIAKQKSLRAASHPPCPAADAQHDR